MACPSCGKEVPGEFLFCPLCGSALAEAPLRPGREERKVSGETSRSRTPEARDQLTPQELQIAQLAAGGLSNQEIGQRLFISHRTVSTHLYGITSRPELSDALGAASGDGGLPPGSV